ncbi:MAG: iron-containing alcohol dehydrogenase family protein [Pantoea sp.]|uniref:iron-containing alcohol dehydrogenase family protein n=1 Tax=Pantoea septica TaxID=472695 RepID=UPI001C11FDC8|nr:iron-containing alcohol dehydrogenase family protein [Pantoea septica]MBU5379797.1 iron-containing alcohol dehydrogenase family protein [Pantoea septica]MDU5838269.1 iron-containing alcohol dehydrogenase family protein [Pantoea sp.]MDU6439636.1 iron-containing alcohol dehydrogenase family protein [Pantoea sp.]
MLAIKSPQAYLQQAGIRARAGEHIRPIATHLRILSSPRAWQAVNPELTQSLESQGIRWQLELLDGECTDEAISQLKANTTQQGAEAILAVGGGRVLDCAKAAGDGLDKVAVINFATLAATCAAWSPVAIVYNAQGAHLRSQPLCNMPALVLVDSEIIARSDARYLNAGIVDALAKWYEFRPYQRHNPDSLALDLKVMAAQRAVDAYRQWGDEAVEANRQQQATFALERIIDANIVLAGLANSMRDTLPTPGYAHAIHNRLTGLPELHPWLHGEKVGFSLLVQSFMEQGNGEPDPALVALLRRFAAPLKLPALAGDRAAALHRLAAEVRFPAASAARLPFDVSPAALEQALIATDHFS